MNDVVFRQTSFVMRSLSKSPVLTDAPGVALPSCSPPVTLSAALQPLRSRQASEPFNGIIRDQ